MLDKVANAFGTMFLDFCSACKCSILNGLEDFDCDGSPTFVIQNDSSVVEYFVSSNDLRYKEIVYSLKVEYRMEKAHIPVVLILGKPRDKVIEPAPQWMDEIVWDTTKESDSVRFEFSRGATFLPNSLKRA